MRLPRSFTDMDCTFCRHNGEVNCKLIAAKMLTRRAGGLASCRTYERRESPPKEEEPDEQLRLS